MIVSLLAQALMPMLIKVAIRMPVDLRIMVHLSAFGVVVYFEFVGYMNNQLSARRDIYRIKGIGLSLI